MLIDFSAANFKSVRDEALLSMTAQDRKAPDLRYKRELPGQDFSLLTAAIIFGANASGKSTIIEALAVLAELVQESGSYVRGQKFDQIQPFKLQPGMEKKPTTFEVEFLAAGSRFRYLLSLTRERVVRERLSTFTGKREALLFERLNDDIEFGARLAGRKKSIEVWPNTLYLSRAALANQEQLMAVHAWFAFPYQRPGGERRRWNRTAELALSNTVPEDKPWIEAFLRAADLGIEGFDRIETLGGPGITFRHLSENRASVSLDMAEESSGTKNLFSAAFLIIHALRNGTLLLLDEPEAGVHPALIQAILELFRDPASNPRNAQLIMTSHTASLLNPDLVRRDQVWFTEKDKAGVTRLFSLQDFDKKEIRAESAFERLYLAGKLGAVPRIKLSELMREGGSDA